MLASIGFVASLPACSPDTRQDRKNGPETHPVITRNTADTAVQIAELDRIGPGAKTDRAALHRLARAIRDPRHAVAARAAYWLSQVGAPAVPGLIEALSDSSLHVRQSACYALGLVGAGARGSVPALTRQLGGASDSVANMADWALTQILGSRKSTMVEQLRDLRYGTRFERMASASSLALLGEGAADAIPLLVRSLIDSSGAVAASAGDALVSIGRPAIPALQAALQSDNRLLRSRALGVLGRLPPRTHF